MKLFIIGNGFDKGHGLNTSYWDFRTYLKNMYPEFLYAFESRYYIYPANDEEAQKNLLWNELEKNLANIDEDVIIDDALQMDMALESGDVGIEDTLYEYFTEEYKYIERLAKYLKQWVRTIRIRDVKPKTSLINSFQEALYITFNYTAVLERAYGISDSKIIHIHGSLREHECDPVLGHGNIGRIERIDELLKKLLDIDDNLTITMHMQTMDPVKAIKMLKGALDELLRYGDVLNLIQTDETDRVVERKEVPLFDNKAFREAIINAVLHNKWVEGNEPMISVFSDRIEILSRGTLAPAQTMEGFFLGESIPVNEKLSEIFLQLHISEKSGRGVPKITEMYGKDAFSFRENSIVVTIPFERINKVGNKVGKKVGDKKPLNSRRQKIIAEMRDNPNITTAELHNILGVSETAVENNISFLRENGYIERVGSKKAGYWKVL